MECTPGTARVTRVQCLWGDETRGVLSTIFTRQGCGENVREVSFPVCLRHRFSFLTPQPHLALQLQTCQAEEQSLEEKQNKTLLGALSEQALAPRAHCSHLNKEIKAEEPPLFRDSDSSPVSGVRIDPPSEVMVIGK